MFDDTCEDLGIEGAVGRLGVLPLLGLMNRDAAVCEQQKRWSKVTHLDIIRVVLLFSSAPLLTLKDTHSGHDSLLALRMLQELMEHLRLLHVSTCAGSGADGILRYHWLRLQVHGIVPVGWEWRRGSHVTHVFWCHGSDHVRI